MPRILPLRKEKIAMMIQTREYIRDSFCKACKHMHVSYDHLEHFGTPCVNTTFECKYMLDGPQEESCPHHAEYLDYLEDEGIEEE